MLITDTYGQQLKIYLTNNLTRSVSVCHPPEIVHGDTDHSSPLQPGDLLKIRCHTGYSLDVMPNIVCQDDGTYGNTAIPPCIGLFKSIDYSSMPHLIKLAH